MVKCNIYAWTSFTWWETIIKCLCHRIHPQSCILMLYFEQVTFIVKLFVHIVPLNLVHCEFVENVWRLKYSKIEVSNGPLFHDRGCVTSEILEMFASSVSPIITEQKTLVTLHPHDAKQHVFSLAWVYYSVVWKHSTKEDAS